jgi:putative glutamine amidotransferase
VRRPLIGITAGYSARDVEVFSVRDDYVRAVESAGGLAIVLAPSPGAAVSELLDRLDGVLLSGGGDIDPSFYAREAHPSTCRVAPDRDAFELELCRQALSRDLPLLAICRGHQVLNVATGGTLIQDIPSQLAGAGEHDPDTERWQPAHEVRILPGTRLREILKSETMAVNSFHHQAVEQLGAGVVSSALAVADGVVEGIELPGRRLALGVQWHPEAFWDHQPDFQPLFAALVTASRDA